MVIAHGISLCLSLSLCHSLSSTLRRACPQWRKLDLNGTNAGGAWGGTLDVLVRGLLPAHLRVGGTQADYDAYAGFHAGGAGGGYYPVGEACSHLPTAMTDYRCQEVTSSEFARLLAFTKRNNLTLVYGLNEMWGRPTKTKGPEKPLCSDTDNNQQGFMCPPSNQTNAQSLLTWLGKTRPDGCVVSV